MDKIQNLKDLKYYANIQLCLGLALKWSKLKPKNKEIQGLSKAIMDISLYVIQLQTDLNTNKEAVSDYRYRKNKALLELTDIKKKYDNLIKLEENN